MRRVGGSTAPALVGGAVLLLASCSSEREPAAPEAQRASAAPSPAAARAAAPDLAACSGREPADDSLRERTRPIPVPTPLKDVMRSDMENFAISTLGGATVCIDASWMERVSDAKLSEDGRFASFDWMGYEAYGHVIVDRSGKGTVIDTGVPPMPSPSGKQLAALDYGEAGFGALNALGVWDIGPARLTEVARLETLPDNFHWRLDRWGGEACLELSGIAWDDVPEDPRDYDQAPRRRYIARLVGRALKLEIAPEGGCKAA